MTHSNSLGASPQRAIREITRNWMFRTVVADAASVGSDAGCIRHDATVIAAPVLNVVLLADHSPHTRRGITANKHRTLEPHGPPLKARMNGLKTQDEPRSPNRGSSHKELRKAVDHQYSGVFLMARSDPSKGTKRTGLLAQTPMTLRPSRAMAFKPPSPDRVPVSR